MRPHAEDRPTATEERLRAAFAARAALVTPRDLRRAAPPRGRSRGLRRVRGIALAGLGAAAAVAAAYVLVLLPGGPSAPPPAPPAGSPGVHDSPAVPTPTPAPAAPSVTDPGPGPEPVEGP
ncbi:hypothetical protein [Streptomyces zaomyceticus]|uniref:hypothetical protein n=1 Tax=Streptomyces zaomyceticus TaxID=68286 RepID=UPI002E1FD735